jgi:hypothetical protein
MHSGGKTMQNFKALRTRTWFAISLILGFALVTFGCDTSKLVLGELVTSKSQQISDFSDFEISAKAVPEGILVTFFDIPSEIEKLIISVYDWGDNKDAVMKIWDEGKPFAVMDSLSNIRGHNNCENVIERVRQNGTIIFPFVQPGRKYEITASFSDSNDVQQGWTEKMARAECVADGGIYLDRDITININDARTSVALSSEPALTSGVQLEEMFYSICIHGGHLEWITSGETNDLFWEFEPMFREHLKEAGLANGDYPANAGVCLKVIYDNISWWLESVKTPVFTYSL